MEFCCYDLDNFVCRLYDYDITDEGIEVTTEQSHPCSMSCCADYDYEKHVFQFCPFCGADLVVVKTI